MGSRPIYSKVQLVLLGTLFSLLALSFPWQSRVRTTEMSAVSGAPNVKQGTTVQSKKGDTVVITPNKVYRVAKDGKTLEPVQLEQKEGAAKLEETATKAKTEAAPPCDDNCQKAKMKKLFEEILVEKADLARNGRLPQDQAEVPKLTTYTNCSSEKDMRNKLTCYANKCKKTNKEHMQQLDCIANEVETLFGTIDTDKCTKDYNAFNVVDKLIKEPAGGALLDEDTAKEARARIAQMVDTVFYGNNNDTGSYSSRSSRYSNRRSYSRGRSYIDSGYSRSSGYNETNCNKCVRDACVEILASGLHTITVPYHNDLIDLSHDYVNAVRTNNYFEKFAVLRDMALTTEEFRYRAFAELNDFARNYRNDPLIMSIAQQDSTRIFDIAAGLARDPGMLAYTSMFPQSPSGVNGQFPGLFGPATPNMFAPNQFGSPYGNQFGSPNQFGPPNGFGGVAGAQNPFATNGYALNRTSQPLGIQPQTGMNPYNPGFYNGPTALLQNPSNSYYSTYMPTASTTGSYNSYLNLAGTPTYTTAPTFGSMTLPPMRTF